jgi:hypothetical protein
LFFYNEEEHKLETFTKNYAKGTNSAIVKAELNLDSNPLADFCHDSY